MLQLCKVTLLVTLCLTTVSSIGLHDFLPHYAMLDSEGQYLVSWDFDDEKIVFSIVASTLGYIGFGISPKGGMKGADIVIAGVDQSGNVYLSDRHATGQQLPEEDSKKVSDWKAVWGSEADTHTTIRIWRKLDTCDEDDRIITGDTLRVIWAYHSEDWDVAKNMYSGYHGDQRGTKSILFLNPQKELPNIPGDSYTMDFINSGTPVPSTDTTYWCEGFSVHGFKQKEHVIKFEPIIEPGHEQLVHHIVLLACPSTMSNSTAGQSGVCFTNDAPFEWMSCLTTVFAWAVGGSPFYFPEHVGFPFGLEDSPTLYILQTHYDNPKRTAGYIDFSGIRLTITRKLRQYDAGVVVAGGLSTKRLMIPPHAEMFRIDGHCVPECITQSLGNVSEINVFATFPHAHLLARAIKFRHIRNGKELKPITVDNNYDFNYQETRLLEEEVKVRQGDHLITECSYNSLARINVTFGGEGTWDEMCLTFALYYPRTGLANCYSVMDIERLGEFANVKFFPNRTVDEPEHLRGQEMADIFNDNINWKDKGKRDQFQELVTTYDNHVQALCFGDRFPPINGQLVKLPEIKEPLPKSRPCGLETAGRISTALLSGAASPRRLAEDTQQAPSPVTGIILTPGQPVAALTPIAERQAKQQAA